MVEIVLKDDDVGRIDPCDGASSGVWPWVVRLLERWVEGGRITECLLLQEPSDN
jgi:hypothetical protein